MREILPPISYAAACSLAREQFSLSWPSCAAFSAAFLSAASFSCCSLRSSCARSAGDIGPDFAVDFLSAAGAAGAAAAGPRLSIVADLLPAGHGDWEYTVLPPASTHLNTCACALPASARNETNKAAARAMGPRVRATVESFAVYIAQQGRAEVGVAPQGGKMSRVRRAADRPSAPAACLSGKAHPPESTWIY